MKLPEPVKGYVNIFPRQALHAASLGFMHPRTGKFLSFTANFPKDMQMLQKELEFYKL